MTLVLSVLGQILVGVADAQVSMCQSLEALLLLLLEAFTGVELNKVTRLKGFQILHPLDSIKTHRNFELNDSTLASLTA